MNRPWRNIITLSIALVMAAGLILLNAVWLVPRLHSLRTRIDNDRASSILVVQQQANLLLLRQELAGIDTKQTELETNVWLFVKEEDFFSTFDALAKQWQVTVDITSIADATPNGSILPRTATIKMDGAPAAVLNAINEIQTMRPLVAIQKASLGNDPAPKQLHATITAMTLWK